MRLLTVLLVLIGTAGCLTTSGSDRQDEDWLYRRTVEIDAAGFVRHDRPVVVPFRDDDSRPAVATLEVVRVAEVDSSGAALRDAIPFQVDEPSGGEGRSLVFLLSGETAPTETRTFHVFYGADDEDGTRAVEAGPVSAEDDVFHEQQASIRVDTPHGTYYYHKQGAGFASLDDADGNDWIGYRPGGGSAGEYRGIPNLVYPEGHFHPGSESSTSVLVSDGPIRARIRSRTRDGLWECTWTVYPSYATMTLHKAANPYWFLYEGTPGGTLEVNDDYLVLASGELREVSASWGEDLPAPEWLYFADGELERALLIAHHGDDDRPDQFYEMEGNMTVFGFGREHRCCGSYLTAVPAQFTVALIDSRSHAVIQGFIDDVVNAVDVRLGPLEARSD